MNCKQSQATLQVSTHDYLQNKILSYFATNK